MSKYSYKSLLALIMILATGIPINRAIADAVEPTVDYVTLFNTTMKCDRKECNLENYKASWEYKDTLKEKEGHFTDFENKPYKKLVIVRYYPDPSKAASKNNRADLQHANLQAADFASLSDGDTLSIVDLRYANFTHANLEGAKFMDADLRHAEFKEAKLKNADFSGADLRGAEFLETAELDGAIFINAKLDPTTRAMLESKRNINFGK